MNRVEAALRKIASDLNALHFRWALVDGFAVSVRTEPRFTRDVDVAVVVDDDQAAERLVRLLIDKGYRLEAIGEQDSVGRLASARMISPGADRLGVVVDVLFATAGIEAEIAAAAEVLEVLPAFSLRRAGRTARSDDARPRSTPAPRCAPPRHTSGRGTRSEQLSTTLGAPESHGSAQRSNDVLHGQQQVQWIRGRLEELCLR